MAPTLSAAPLPMGSVRTGKTGSYITSAHRFLATNQFEAAHMSLQVIAPRPDSERTAASRYSWAHSAFAYNVVVAVQGGAPPFKFELVSGPSGATCEAEAPSWNPYLYLWGRVNWPSPAGTGTFLVRVIDSEGTTKLVKWTCVQNNTKFRFLDAAAGSDSNDGILVADGGTGPWQTTDAWKGANYADTTWQNLICVYRTGTYTLSAYTGVLLSLGTNKPKAHIHYPGETATWGLGSARVQIDAGGQDFYFSIATTGGTTENNPRLFEWTSNAAATRVVFDEVSFASPADAVVANSNYSCIAFMDTAAGVEHKYVALVNCAWSDLPESSGTNGLSCFDWYRTIDSSIVGGTGRAINGAYGWWPKGPCNRISMWGIDGWDESGNTVERVKFPLFMASDEASSPPLTELEVGYCRATAPDNTGNQAAVLTFGVDNHPWGPIHCYRMTLTGAVGWNGTVADAGANGTQTFSDSLVYCDLGSPVESGLDTDSVSVQARSVMATDLTSGNVKPVSAFYGVRGADVAQA